ncbi:hypothetical protein AB0M05_19990 [Streptomyces violaceusniger]
MAVMRTTRRRIAAGIAAAAAIGAATVLPAQTAPDLRLRLRLR